MALTWIEDGDSRQATIVRRGRNATSTMSRSYKVFGTNNDVELHNEINQAISTQGYGWQYPGVPGATLWVESYSVSYLGDDAWQVTINYEKKGAEPAEPQPLKRARSFDTTGGTQHITQAMDGTVTFGSGDSTTVVTTSGETKFPPSTAPSLSGAINVDDSGVNGVDIVVPQLQWQESYDVPNAYVTDGYVRQVAAMTGTVNNSTFRGFDAGEVLFLGCSGSQEWDDQKGRGPWSLTYRFAASPNVTNQTIGTVTGVNKRGHDYLWVRYESASENNELIKKPKYVYVDKVYRDGDFSRLGIG